VTLLAASMLAGSASSGSSSLADQPGTLGFLVVFGMAIILYFVFRSMAKHLRKVNTAAAQQEAAAASTDNVTASAPPDAAGPR
jgi:Na+/proline symporter